MSSKAQTEAQRTNWPDAIALFNASPAQTASNHPLTARGLTSTEAAARRQRLGPNTTPDVHANPTRLILSKFIAPVPCLLEAAILLQLFLHEYVEAAVVGVLLVFNAALGFLHERRAQRTIEALEC